jgi:nucleoid-associated protein YgaU
MRTTDTIMPGTGRRGGTAGLGALALGGLAAARLLAARVAGLLGEGLAAPRVEQVVELVVVGVGAATAAWVALSAFLALACVAAARAGRGWRAGEAALARLAPGAVQRLARAAVGVGVGAGLALVPVAAHAVQDGDMPPAPPVAAVPLDLGWQVTPEAPAAAPSLPATPSPAPAPTEADGLPARIAPTEPQPIAVAPADPQPAELTPVADAQPTSATPAIPAPTAASTGVETRRAVVVADDGTVVVHRGDTLWDIAAATLGDGATDADILRAVVRWHDVNRDVVGDDPDLILPGQVLRAPA